MRTHKEVDYSNFKFTPGYTGFAAKHVKDINFETVKVKRNHRFYVPGYSGFVPQIKAENVFGSSYARTSALSNQGLIECKRGDINHNHWDNISSVDKYRSTIQVNFDNKHTLLRH